MRVPSGTTNQNVYFVAVDPTDFTTRETGLTGFTVYRSRNGGTPVAMTTPTITEVDATNMPGVYSLLLDEDTTITAGDDSQELALHITEPAMAPVTRSVELYRPKATLGQTITTASGVASADVVQISGDSLAADNLELQYDTTGITGDHFPATQEQVSRLSVASGLLNTRCDSYTLTTGTQSANTFAATFSTDGVYHEHTDTAGTLDLYYEFDLGLSGVGASVDIIGRINSSNDSLEVFAYNWLSLTWEKLGDLVGTNSPNDSELLLNVDQVHTGTGANAGKLRIRFAGTGLTSAVLYMDKIAAAFTTVTSSSFILDSGLAQAATVSTIQLASGASTVDKFYNRARVIIAQGTGDKQERIITDYDGATLTAVVTPPWTVTPDNTSVYSILPGQVHSTTRNGGYDNAYVYVDGINGVAGTLLYVNGTTTNPSSNMADARALADELNISKFRFEGGSLLSLDQSYQNFAFEALSAQNFNLNGQDISGSIFKESGVIGTASASSRVVFKSCGLVGVSIGVASALECGLQGTFTCLNNERYGFQRCAEIDAAGATMNVNGDGVTPTTVELTEYYGRATLTNMTAVDAVIVTGNARVTLDASCTGGTLLTAGDVTVIDNSGSVTITQGLTGEILDDTTALSVDMAAVLANTNNLIADDVPGLIAALNDPTATAIASEVWDTVCETEGAYSAQEIMSVILAVCAGVTSNNGSTLKTPNGVATRVNATIDLSQNRTAMTVNPSV